MKPRPITESFIDENGNRVWRVPLTRGKFALVDNQDLERVSAHNWSWNASSKYENRQSARSSLWIDGRVHSISMHRLILEVQDGLEIDHINQDPLDNRRSNLRICTRSENLRNRRGWTTNKKSALHFKGVSRLPDGRYKVIVVVGTFESEIEATKA